MSLGWMSLELDESWLDAESQLDALQTLSI